METTPPRRVSYEPWDDQHELTEDDLREIGREAARKLRAILWTKKALRHMQANKGNAEEPET